MKDHISIAIADDHNLIREAIIEMLQSDDSIQVLFGVGNGKELLDNMVKFKPQIIILDIEMPVLSGTDTLRMIRQRYPKTKVIILSSHYQKDVIIKFIKLGANSFLPKDCNRAKLLEAIHTVHNEGQYFDKEISVIMAKELASASKSEVDRTSIVFSDVELSIIKMICQNKINKEIAEGLSLSVRTIEWHRLSIMKSIKSKDVNDLILYAIQNKLISVV